jgi:hypothetical protein
VQGWIPDFYGLTTVPPMAEAAEILMGKIALFFQNDPKERTVHG